MKFANADGKPIHLDLSRVNRHGLITGATGTGKTVTLQTLAENLSYEGVSVFCADVKGDLSGIAMRMGDKIDPNVVLWDLLGKDGWRIKTTVENVGSMLLARMMGLTEVQESVLALAFAYARSKSMPLDTLGHLQRALYELVEHRDEVRTIMGNVTAGSVGAIQRALTIFRDQAGDAIFGTPAFDVTKFIHQNPKSQRGRINVLAAYNLMDKPQLYAMFLLWLIVELSKVLPEIGDQPKPKLVFFFDEAHLLFDGSNALEDTLLRAVRLIRSKGVGVYFVTQRPNDLPEPVLAQLSNRFQHALRAYTPGDMRAVRAVASGLRPNPSFDTLAALTGLQIGEALASTVLPNGEPSIVQRVKVDLPFSRLGPLTNEERGAIARATKDLFVQYDREEAWEPEAKPEPVDPSVKPARSPYLKAVGMIIQLMIALPFIGLLVSCIAMFTAGGGNHFPK